MKTAAIFASLIASASALAAKKAAAPAKKVVVSSFEGELGVQQPLGFFDPLGMLNGASETRFGRLREVEVKHGRVCMLAVAGYLTTAAGIRLPGLISYDGTKFADIPSGFDALSAVPKAGITQIFIFIFFLELIMRDITGGAEFIGDFRNGLDFGWDKFDEATKLKKRAIELNNGRAAQMGILGLMVHEKMGNLGSILPIPYSN